MISQQYRARRCKEYTRNWRSCVATVNKRFEQRYRAGIVSAGQFQFAISSPPIVWERRAWSLRVSCRQCTSYRVSPPQHYLAVFITRFNGVVQSFQPKPSLPPSSSIDHVATNLRSTFLVYLVSQKYKNFVMISLLVNVELWNICVSSLIKLES